MAKNDVTLKFDAQTGEYVQKILAARQAYEANADAARKMGDQTSAAGDKMVSSMSSVSAAGDQMAEHVKGAFESAASALGAFTTLAGGVSMGFNALVQGEQRSLDELERRAELIRARSRSITEALSQAGQQSSIDTVTTSIKAMSDRDFAGTKLSQTELSSALAVISADLKDKVSAEEKTRGVWAYARGRGEGLSDEAAKELGINFTHAAVDRKPSETDDQVYERARRTTQALGLVDPGIRRMMTKFQDPEFATELAEGAGHTEEGRRVLGTISELSEKEVSAKEHREMLLRLRAAKHENEAAAQIPQDLKDEARRLKLTPDERKKVIEMQRGADQFTEADARTLVLATAAPGQDRARKILENPDLAPPENQEQLRKLSNYLRNRGKAVGGDQAALAYTKSAAGQIVVTAQNEKSFADFVDESEAQAATEQQTLLNLRRSKFAKDNPFLHNVLPDTMQTQQSREENDAEQKVYDLSHDQSGNLKPGISQSQLETAYRRAEIKTLTQKIGTPNVVVPAPLGPPAPPARTVDRPSTPIVRVDAASTLQVAPPPAIVSAPSKYPVDPFEIRPAKSAADSERIVSAIEALHSTIRQQAAGAGTPPAKPAVSVPGLGPNPFDMPRGNSGLWSGHVGQQ